MEESRQVPLKFDRLSVEEQVNRVRQHHDRMITRRTVRSFLPEPIPTEILEWAIRVAASAPSGANLQPWRFVIVSDAATKRSIREAAEAEERLNYETRFPPEWKRRLGPLGTDWHKEFLEIAPHLIVVFAVTYGQPLMPPEGTPGEFMKHYYVNESVGIATGFLLSALHLAGLATLTHTPSPMGFLRTILGRPANERPYLLIPTGYPSPDAVVRDIGRKTLGEMLIRFGGI